MQNAPVALATGANAGIGRQVAKDLAGHGYTVAVHNRTPARTRALVEEFGHEGAFVPAESAEEFVAALERPRRLMLMVRSYASAGRTPPATCRPSRPAASSGRSCPDLTRGRKRTTPRIVG